MPKRPDRRSYTIRAVNAQDDTVARILRDMHAKVFDDTAPQIEPGEGHWWIAWMGDEPAGFAGLLLSKTPETGYLHRSGVLPPHRGNGLQVKLIRAREAKARELGLKRMVSDTTDNIPSANSLIRAGYRLFSPVSKWAFGDDSLYWQKAL